jgi:hypothetical protein
MKTNKDFQAVADLVEAAPLSADCKRTLRWCLDQLPKLYAQFVESHDVHFSDKIARLEQGVLKELGKETKAEPKVGKVTDAILDRLKALHAQHGLQSLDPRPAKPKPTKASKASKPKKVG